MKKIAIEIKWGILFTIAILLWTGLERLVGLHDQYIAQHFVYTNLFAIVAIVIFVFAMRDKRENYYQGVMSWKQGFITGCIISVVVAVLSPLSTYIAHEFVSPGYFPNIIAYSVEQGEYATAEEAAEMFNLSSYIIQGAIFALISGVITSAIVAIFVRRKGTAKVI